MTGGRAAGTAPAVIMAVPEAHRVGGFERQAFRLADALARRGVTVRIATHRLPAEPRRPAGTDDVPLDVVPVANRRSGGAALACARYLLGQRRRLGPAVVHAHSLGDFSLLMLYAARRLGLPTLIKVATAGDIERFCTRPFAAKPVHRLGPRMRDVLFGAGAVVTLNALSADEARRFWPAGPSRIVAFSNMVREPHDAGAAGDGGAVLEAIRGLRDQGRRIALMVNRLEKRKNTLPLVRHWCALPGTLRDRWRLLIVGDGEEKEALQSFLAARGDASVRLMGERVEHETALGEADLFILASAFEGNPNGLMEAVARGTRVLLTDIEGAGDCVPVTASDRVFSLGDPERLPEDGLDRLRDCLERIDGSGDRDAAGGTGAEGAARGTGGTGAAALAAASRGLFGEDLMCDRYLWLYRSLSRKRGAQALRPT